MAPEKLSTREQYLNNISVKNIVAFRNQDQMFSGMVIEIAPTGTLTLRTKNGSIFYVEKADIVWVKNGTHWPVGIFNALKYSKRASDRTEP